MLLQRLSADKGYIPGLSQLLSAAKRYVPLSGFVPLSGLPEHPPHRGEESDKSQITL